MVKMKADLIEQPASDVRSKGTCIVMEGLGVIGFAMLLWYFWSP